MDENIIRAILHFCKEVKFIIYFMVGNNDIKNQIFHLQICSHPKFVDVYCLERNKINIFIFLN